MHNKHIPITIILTLILAAITTSLSISQASAPQTYLPLIIKAAPIITITPTPTAVPIPPTIVPTATPTAVPTSAPTSTPSPPQGCNTCASNEYNCTDFDDWASAQACYEYCLDQVGYDVHRLNNDPTVDNCACDCNAGAPSSCGCTQKASKQLTPAQRLQMPSTEICYL
ncbi:MAG: hypothetical protein KDE48_24505 [Anaerolineales bacterium]|nr:hypothetical protein [Anaerolineales bacterium]